MDHVSHTLDTRTSAIDAEPDAPRSAQRVPPRTKKRAARIDPFREVHDAATERARHVVRNLVDLLTHAYTNGDRVDSASDHLLSLLVDARELELDVEELSGLR